MTQNYFDAEDLTQETFLAVYKSLAEFDGVNPGGFITRIATNKCLDYLKRADRRATPTEDDVLYPKVKAILNMFPGESQAVLYFADTKVRLGTRCQLAEPMLRELENVLGQGNVVLK